MKVRHRTEERLLQTSADTLGELAPFPAYPVQPSLAILGCGSTRYWTQLGNTEPVFFQYLCKIHVILVAMLQTLKGKTQVISSSWAKVLFFSYHTLLQLPPLHGLPHSHTTSLWTTQFSLLAYTYPTTPMWQQVKLLFFASEIPSSTLGFPSIDVTPTSSASLMPFQPKCARPSNSSTTKPQN